MNKINIDLTINNSLKEVTFNDTKILVKTYLPIEEKLNLVEIVMQNAIEFNFVNPIKTKAYFNAYVVIKYTNIDFSNYIDDIPALYDLVKRSGLLDLVVGTAEKDYDELADLCDAFVDRYENYQNSLYGIISQVLSDAPAQLKKAVDEIAKLDMSKLKEMYEGVATQGGNQAAIVEALYGKVNNN